MFKPANKSTLHDDVLAQMTEAISQGTWGPGSRLPGEQALAEQFEVSRNCIREVLKALALSGVVEARPGSGTFLSLNALRQLKGNKLVATMLDESSLRELMEMRCLIEGQVAYWATERATDKQIKELGKILAHKSKSLIDNHARFHDALAEIVGNRLLFRFLESIKGELEFSRQRFRKMPDRSMEEHNAHHLIVYDRIKNRDAAGARKAMIDHILSGWHYLLEEDELLAARKAVAWTEKEL